MTAMVYVIAFVCLTATHECREIAADEQVALSQCLSAAIVLGANWVANHPEWEFISARCDTNPPEPDGRDL
jgi:hypothetical protein